jgi:hypothetical protein
MKNRILICLLFVTTGALAEPFCWVNGEKGHIDFTLNQESIDSGKPFGVIKGTDLGRRNELTLTLDGERTVIEFKGTLSITRQDANLVCLRR